MGSLSNMSAMDALILHQPPPLDPAWLAYEQLHALPTPRPVPMRPQERQPIYAAECRALHASMMAPGARDFHLSHGITSRALTVPSRLDGFPIPLIRYDLAPPAAPPSGQAGAAEAEAEAGANPAEQEKDQQAPPAQAEPHTVILYLHGGGLHVGEADSEELSCRRILKESALPTGGPASAPPPTLYSVGYRLMPQHPAATCVSDAADSLAHVRALHPAARLLLVGSSSGGQLAALASQAAPRGALAGVVLRCPVTTDVFSGTAFVPARWRAMHTSAAPDLRFQTSLLGVMARAVPRDGLPRMPLEAGDGELRGLPRHWIQVCSNDMLYSDGVCYAAALEAAGVEVQVDVVTGWPHAPQLARALEADRAMLKGLAWVAEGVGEQ